MALLACEQGDQPYHASDATVRDSAGVTIVENEVGGEVPRLTAVETRRIGVLAGDEPYQFSQIYAVTVSPSDNIFVGNSQTGTVRMFSPDGVFVREFGGIGDGPHEVQLISDVWLSGDTVVVWDPGRRRTVLFRTSGEFITSWSNNQTDGTRVTPKGHGEHGWIAEVRPRVRFDGNPGDSVGEVVELRGFDPSSAMIGEEIFVPPRRPQYLTRSGVDEALFRVFGSDFDGIGRFFRTRLEKYEIAVYEPDGTLERLVRRSYQPRLMGTADIEEYRRLLQVVLDTNTEWPPGAIDDQVWAALGEQTALPLPETWTPIRRLLVADNGFLWAENVESVTPGAFELINVFGPMYEDRSTGSVWDLFDVDGLFLGQVQLPPRFEAMAVRGTEVTGVMKDELDVEYVVTYQVQGRGASLSP